MGALKTRVLARTMMANMLVHRLTAVFDTIARRAEAEEAEVTKPLLNQCSQ